MRDHEVRVSLLLQLYIFLIISALLLVKSTINALFLSELGADNLSFAYIFVAVSAIITSYFYSRALHRNSIRRLIISSLSIFSFLFLSLFVLLIFEVTNPILLYFFYVSVALFAVITTSQFWLLANMIYNARQAKRLFSFIGAGAIAGGIFGGYLTSIIASSFDNKYVILTAALLILLCLPIFFSIWKIKYWKLQKLVLKQKVNRESKFAFRSLKLIRNSKHLTYLSIIVGVSVLVAKLVDFQFSDFASKSIPDSNKLASFFGFWFSSFNVLALIIQLFFTNKLLSYFGITANLLVLPLGIAFGSLLFLTFPELWVLIIIKGLDGSLKQSLNKASMELSILPIPLKIKRQAKSYIDVVVDSVATGFAGFILYFVIRKLELETSYITVIILLFLFVWIVLVYRLREEYFNSFKANLMKNMELRKSSKKLSRGSSIKSAIQVFESGDEQRILHVLRELNSYKLQSLKKDIIQLLDHPSKRVKIEVIQLLYSYKKGTASDKIIKLIQSKHPKLIQEALEYLLLHSKIKNHQLFSAYLDHENPKIANAALSSLARESIGRKELDETYFLEKRIQNQIDQYHDVDQILENPSGFSQLLMIIAISKKKKYYYLIEKALTSTNDVVVLGAIKAAGVTSDTQFVEDLISLLEVRKYRRSTRKALRKFDNKLAEHIYSLLKKGALSDTVKEQLPKVLGSFRNKHSIRILMELLQHDHLSVRYSASKALFQINQRNKLRIRQSKLTRITLEESLFLKKTLSLLSAAEELPIEKDPQQLHEFLVEKRNQSFRLIFNLLSMQNNNSYMEVVYYGIQSEQQEVRANTLEFLDNLLPSKLKLTLLPLIEYTLVLSDAEKLKPYLMKVSSKEHFYQMLSSCFKEYAKTESL
jgi:AAA family ATP:ADP antiporter